MKRRQACEVPDLANEAHPGKLPQRPTKGRLSMNIVLTRSALSLFTACLVATPALADPSAQSRQAGVIMPAPSMTTDTGRPKPIHWDRVERSAIERAAKARKRVLPPNVPAESVER
jgi:hypothetical protein